MSADKWRKTLTGFCLPLIAPLLFLIGWEFAARRLGNDLILPTLESVGALVAHPTDDLIGMGSLLANAGISLARVMCGYLLSALIAIPLGIAMGYSKTTDRLFTGFLGLFRSIAPLAWVPLVLAWFGVASLASLFNMPVNYFYLFLHNIKLSMLFIIFIGGFYPILTSSMHGVRMTPATLLDAARVLGADDRALFCKVLLPATAPAIVNGLRIGLGMAWMCLVAAEMLPGSLSGVGYLITLAYTVGRTDVVIVGMVAIGLVGAAMDWAFRLLEERKFAWKRLAR